MATILHIETSTEVCSVAVSQDGLCVFEREDREGPNHAVKSGVFIDEALSHIDSQLLTLDAVAVSGGPGSYTGLRIGVSTAKGVSFGRDARLISVPTLEVLCVPVLLQEKVKEDDALLCPMLDARRMEVYAALFDRSLREVRPTQADIVDGDTYRAFLDERPVYFFGNGAAKCMEVIDHPNARFIEGVVPLARWMFPLAERRFFDQKFEDVAYFEPFYLKDFVAKAARDLLNIEN
ncbi:MAG: tRNA (adenosine(37)-N6)-threonylcarbamoyltransferase complex dimerization subunit type 1 TsaB [Prevotella sp.]|nr:tRNA (adenosine(37)-N6)-threonylcarbamoyltransferase complex dimerization subunit type 1 TsaB [Prevotella sp.]